MFNNLPHMFIKIILTFCVKVLGALSAFILSVFIAQKLSLEEAGYFFLMIAVLGLFNFFNLLGLHISTLRFVSIAYKDEKFTEVNGIAILSFLMVLSLGLMTLVFVYFFDEIVAKYLWGDSRLSFIFFYAALISLPVSLNILISHWLQAMSKAVVAVFFLSVSIPFIASLFLSLIQPYNSTQVIEWYLIAAVISMTMCLIVFLFFCRVRNFKAVDCRKIIETSIPIWGTSLVYVIINWSGQFIASIWVDASQIALLAIANRSALLVSLILVSVNMIVAPKYASLYSNNKIEEIRFLAKKVTKVLSAIVFPFVMILALFAEFFLNFFGDGYVAASHLLIILLVGQLINVLSGSVGYLLNMTGNERDLNKVAIATCVLVVFLNLTLIPHFGVVGAAISTSISISFQNIVAALCVKKRLGFNIYHFWEK